MGDGADQSGSRRGSRRTGGPLSPFPAPSQAGGAFPWALPVLLCVCLDLSTSPGPRSQGVSQGRASPALLDASCWGEGRRATVWAQVSPRKKSWRLKEIGRASCRERV